MPGMNAGFYALQPGELVMVVSLAETPPKKKKQKKVKKGVAILRETRKVWVTRQGNRFRAAKRKRERDEENLL